jgi:hypothetical protein
VVCSVPLIKARDILVHAPFIERSTECLSMGVLLLVVMGTARKSFVRVSLGVEGCLRFSSHYFFFAKTFFGALIPRGRSKASRRLFGPLAPLHQSNNMQGRGTRPSFSFGYCLFVRQLRPPFSPLFHFSILFPLLFLMSFFRLLPISWVKDHRANQDNMKNRPI